MLAKTPDWMDADFLQAAAAVAVFVAVALAIFALVTVRSLAARLILLAVLGAAAFGAIQYRQSVEDCEKTCDCSLLGEDVPTENCPVAAGTNTDSKGA